MARRGTARPGAVSAALRRETGATLARLDVALRGLVARARDGPTSGTCRTSGGSPAARRTARQRPATGSLAGAASRYPRCPAGASHSSAPPSPRNAAADAPPLRRGDVPQEREGVTALGRGQQRARPDEVPEQGDLVVRVRRGQAPAGPAEARALHPRRQAGACQACRLVKCLSPAPPPAAYNRPIGRRCHCPRSSAVPATGRSPTARNAAGEQGLQRSSLTTLAAGWPAPPLHAEPPRRTS